MRSMGRTITPLLVMIALAGCQKKLEYEKSFTLTAGEIQASIVDPPSREQQVTITVTSSGSPISVHVVPESAHAETMAALRDMKKLDNIKMIASRDKVESETIEATIPAKTGFSVFVSGAKKQTEVKVKVVGK